MALRPNYLVHAPAWDANSGGSIFLHNLVHVLRGLGEDAKIWPWYRDPERGLVHRLRSLQRKPSLLLGYGRKFLNPELDTPLANFDDFRDDSIVIYPEIRLGNPMGARNVVRWLLYRPGLEHPYKFTHNEMFFRAGEMSDIPEITGGASELFVWQRNPAYRNEKRNNRNGACFLVRKGHEKPRIPETAKAIQIDGKNHQEVAEIFNSCETFYSYDEASFYSQYAAICGCTSVVVPGLFPDRHAWSERHPIGRYGIAYGLDDVEHARATRPLVESLLAEKEAEGVESVRAFVAATQDRLG
ncbi:hypothetical protein [Aurantiacibacter rhizosphaerae]|uniref:Glycosyltransferase family 1 protein n=1 Tax=Aurantiacibacter rhizosphaerae TaxID=2691582 RepID=A0A844XIT5_9SPHN|nr:hypothetical protein [Aurantiacibacter rhizosphaerae]MWV29458.1 hypothetical protein [Aurantiacibacter rhizosphaerae]